jgi:hypothetical protein
LQWRFVAQNVTLLLRAGDARLGWLEMLSRDEFELNSAAELLTS